LLAALAALAALAGPARLLLLLLAGLLTAALLLTTLLLTTLLLLAGALIGILILIHLISFQRWAFDAPRPNAETTRRLRPSFRMALINKAAGTSRIALEFPSGLQPTRLRDANMGRYLLLWLLGIRIPILVLIWLFGGLH